MISYIVSHHNRSRELRICLASLHLQEFPKEILVCDNSSTPIHRSWCKQICAPSVYDTPGPWCVQYLDTWASDFCDTCYHSPEYVGSQGDWLCFPSDDSYYVPLFSKLMLQAAEKNGWEFVYCDVLYDPRRALAGGKGEEYSVMITAPNLGSIDKTCFLTTRRAFDAVGGWPEHPGDWRDGALAEAVVKAGIKHGRVPGAMVVHS